jgi:amidase
MARHVRDLRLAFESMCEPDARDPWWTPAPLRGPEVPRRVAVCVDPGSEGVDPDVAAGVRRAAGALRDAGYEVEEVDAPAVAQARDVWAAEVLAEVRVGFLPILEQVASKEALSFLNHAFEAVPPPDYAGYVGRFSARNGVARAWSQFAERYPLVLGPVATAQPFPVGFDLEGPDAVRALLNRLRLVVTANLLALPVAVVPVGMGEQSGLPQGVQLIGGRYREDLCLEAAEAIEERLGVVTPIDPR